MPQERSFNQLIGGNSLAYLLILRAGKIEKFENTCFFAILRIMGEDILEMAAMNRTTMKIIVYWDDEVDEYEFAPTDRISDVYREVSFLTFK